MNRNLFEVAWEVTDRCNLNCIHCYNPRKRRDISTKQAKRTLLEFRDMGVKQVKYGGGEPLLREDFLDLLVETLKLGLDSTFSTNGFIVNSGLVSKIQSTGVSRIQVSLDGTEETHNFIRQNPESYTHAISAIKMFVRAGFKVSVATTLMNVNINCLDDLFRVCSDLGVNRWRVMKYIPTAKKDLMPSVEEYLLAQVEIKEFKARSKGMDVFAVREFDQLCESSDNHDLLCFGGRTIMSVRANGDVSPCSYFPDYVVGNLEYQSARSLWESEKMVEFAREVKGDPRCKHFILCQGGCKAASFYAGNRKCDPYCWVKI